MAADDAPPPAPPPPLAGAPRDAAWFKTRGFDRPVGVEAAGILSRLTWAWATPLVRRGVEGSYDDATAEAFTAAEDDAAVCEAEFDAAYAMHKVKREGGGEGGGWKV